MNSYYYGIKYPLLIFCLVASIGCAEEESWQSPLHVFDTGYWHESSSHMRKAYWLDDNRIAFTNIGHDNDGLYTSVIQDADGHRSVSILDAEKKVITRYDDADTVYCAVGNRIHFNIDYKGNDGTYYVIDKRGIMGSEEVTKGVRVGRWKYKWEKDGKPWSSPQGKVFNNYICDYQADPIIDDSRMVTLLRPEHGYLDFGQKGRFDFKQPTVYVRTDGERVAMPFTMETTNNQIEYYLRENRYLLWSTAKEVMGRQGWAGYAFLPAWWLLPSGEIEEIYIPAEPWSRWGLSTLRYTARGYLIHSVAMKRGRLVGDSGLYLTDLTPNKYKKLVAGVINEVEVSPDGCRVFFSEIPKVGNRLADSLMEKTIPYPSIPRWKLIDLCRDLP